MSSSSISTFDQSESPKDYELPRFISCPSSPGSPPYTPSHAAPVSAWGVEGSTLPLDLPITFGSDGESAIFEDDFNPLSKTPSNLGYVACYEVGSGGWATNWVFGHSQPQTQEYNQGITGDTAADEGINSCVNPCYLHLLPISISPNSTPGPTRPCTPERSEGGKVSAKINRRDSKVRKPPPKGARGGLEFICTWGCGKKFSRKTDEGRHRRTSSAHIGKRQEVYACGLCETTFNRPDNLIAHARKGTKKCRMAIEEKEKKAQQGVHLFFSGHNGFGIPEFAR